MQIWDLIVGFLFSGLGGCIANYIILDRWLWGYQVKYSNNRLKKIEKKIYNKQRFKKIKDDYNITKSNTDRTIARSLGFCERILYTLAIIKGKPEWIAVWLGLKTAVQYEGWKKDIFRRYNIFLVGNAISIFFGVVGANLIKNDLCIDSYYIVPSLILVSLLLMFVIIKIRKYWDGLK